MIFGTTGQHSTSSQYKEDIDKYLLTVQQGIKPGGTMVIGTFSEEGPKKCSGIEIKQYSETAMINK